MLDEVHKLSTSVRAQTAGYRVKGAQYACMTATMPARLTEWMGGTMVSCGDHPDDPFFAPAGWWEINPQTPPVRLGEETLWCTVLNLLAQGL